MNIEGSTFIEGFATVTFIAGFSFRSRVFTIDGFAKYTGTGGFTYSPGTAKQEGMRQLLVLYGIPQGGGNMPLANYSIKSLRPVLTGGNNKLIHPGKYTSLGEAEDIEGNTFAKLWIFLTGLPLDSPNIQYTRHYPFGRPCGYLFLKKAPEYLET